MIGPVNLNAHSQQEPAPPVSATWAHSTQVHHARELDTSIWNDAQIFKAPYQITAGPVMMLENLAVIIIQTG